MSKRVRVCKSVMQIFSGDAEDLEMLDLSDEYKKDRRSCTRPPREHVELDPADLDQGLLRKFNKQPNLQPATYYKSDMIKLLRKMDKLPLRQKAVVEWVYFNISKPFAAVKFVDMGDRSDLPDGWSKWYLDALLATGSKEVADNITLTKNDLDELKSRKRIVGAKKFEANRRESSRLAVELCELLSDNDRNFVHGSKVQIRVLSNYFETIGPKNAGQQRRGGHRTNSNKNTASPTVEFKQLTEKTMLKSGKLVALVGSSGAGKTMLAHDIVRNVLNQGDFSMCFRLEDYRGDDVTTIRDLVLNNFRCYDDVSDDVRNDALKWLKDNQRSLFFILDGGNDDFELSATVQQQTPLAEKPRKVSEIFSLLAMKKLLPNSNVIVTSQPRRFFKLRGFPFSEVYTVGIHDLREDEEKRL